MARRNSGCLLYLAVGAYERLPDRGNQEHDRHRISCRLDACPAKRMSLMLVTLRASQRCPRLHHPGAETAVHARGSWNTDMAARSNRDAPGDTFNSEGEVAHGPVRIIEVQ